MIRALVWKEAREQGLIVTALAVLGAGVLAAVGLLNPSASGERLAQQLLVDPGFLSLVALVVTAGAVVGGTLFAGEKESGTFAYLTGLPVPRWRIWAGKVCGGAVLVLAVAVPLFAVAAGVGIIGPVNTLAGWGLACGAVVLAALGWGSVGSVMARNSLAAAGLGALFAVLASSALFPLGMTAIGEVARRYRMGGGWYDGRAVVTLATLAAVFALFAIPFLISLWTFTEPDRNRTRRAVLGPTPVGKRKPRQPGFRPFAWTKRAGGGFRAAVWLTWRQTRSAALILSAVGLAAGCGLLVPGAPLAAVWPPVSLFLAVLVGVIGWYDEQGSGAGHFWVERRTPVSRLWAAKMIGGLLVTFAVCLAVALPTVLKYSVTRVPWEDRGSWLLFEYDFPRWKYLLVWPVYGFAFGHFAGVLFRKALVATAVAAMTGAAVAAMWLPSLLAGGVQHWQLWLPPLAVLATARALVWSMAAERVGSRRALGRLAVGGLAVLAALGGGIAYRVLEIPDAPVRFDDVTFRTEIPPFETNDAGREVRRAAVILQEVRDSRPAGMRAAYTRNEPTPANFYYLDDPLRWFPKRRQEQLETVMEHGWQRDAEFEAWLDQAFAAGWAEILEAGVTLPLGTVEDPTELTLNSPLRHLHGLHGADTLLLVRALRRQADGDPAAFVRAFETVLGLSRNVRNKSILACALAGRQMERRAHQALLRWLEKLAGRPDLLAEVGCALAHHAAWATDDAADVRLAEQVVFRNTVAAPAEVVKRQWQYADQTDDSTRRVMDTEADLVGFAWVVPWERERLSRLVGLGNRQPYPDDWDSWADAAWGTVFPPRKGRREIEQMGRFPFSGLPGVGWRPLINSWGLTYSHALAEQRVVADRRASVLLLAIRRYELEHGSPPSTLAQLLPDYLPAVPLDPCDGKPFRYRRTGERETITVEERTPKPGLTPEENAEVLILSSPVQSPDDPLAAVVGGSEVVQPRMDGMGMVHPTESPFHTDPTPAAAVMGAAGTFIGPGGLVPGAYHTDRGSQPPAGPFKRRIPLPPGRAVLWSVGSDKIDHGGAAFATTNAGGPNDWVYVVPPAPGDR